MNIRRAEKRCLSMAAAALLAFAPCACRAQVFRCPNFARLPRCWDQRCIEKPDGEY